MKKLILAIIAMVGITGAETLTGKVILAGSKTNAVSAQVCMNGVCGDVASDGSYSLKRARCGWLRLPTSVR